MARLVPLESHCDYYNLGVHTIENGAPKVIKDEEVVRVLEILEEATEVAKSHKK
ncbi:MAG: hypothetical protein IJ137_10945 [Eubacterium sp.]|nr:hypothetical protein [Eubacterium sp.]